MFLSRILAIYISRLFMVSVIAVLAGLTGLVSLFDFLELLRRSASRPNATFGLIVEMAALRVPWAVLEILPFAVLLGGIWAFWRLSRSSDSSSPAPPGSRPGSSCSARSYAPSPSASSASAPSVPSRPRCSPARTRWSRTSSIPAAGRSP